MLLGEAPDAAGREHHERAQVRVVVEALPVGEDGGADGRHPLVWDLADQLEGRRADQAPAVRAADGELDDEVSLAALARLHLEAGVGVGLDPDVRLHRRRGRRRRRGVARDDPEVGRAGAWSRRLAIAFTSASSSSSQGRVSTITRHRAGR